MKMLFLTLLVLLSACGKDSSKSSTKKQNVSKIFGSSSIIVKVYYEEGAEPYTEGPLVGFKYWGIFQNNLEALFQGRSPRPTFVVPKSLSEMTKLSTYNKAQWSIKDVQNMAQKVATKDEAGTLTFSLFFVKGESAEGSGTLGFHINDSYTMVIFKDVIRNSSGTDPQGQAVSVYVEQATIIHEMGHALGLVNNGLPMTASHQDTSNGAHCSNPKCVMYYLNEGTSGLKNFVTNFLSNGGSTVMFDTQCLEDAKNY